MLVYYYDFLVYIKKYFVERGLEVNITYLDKIFFNVNRKIIV